MEKDNYNRTYKRVNGLVNDKIFQEELDLIYVSEELQVTHTPEDKQVERFCIVTALLKASDGKYYKLQVQEDHSKYDEERNQENFTIKETQRVDVRVIGAWQQDAGHGYKRIAIYNYYRPKGKGKHLLKVTKKDSRTIQLGKYCTIDTIRRTDYADASVCGCYPNMTDTYNRRKIKTQDLVRLAEKLELIPNFLATFEL